jgi:predicted ATPase/DNA-binding CsgD family transcriptional regulator
MNSPAAYGGPVAGWRRWPLPADVSGFVGRSGELARLADLLDGARLITVTGPGGVGKTRLALRAVANANAAANANGTATATSLGDICFVELSGLTDPELLPDTVGLRLGLQRAGAASGIDGVLGELRGRKLLLILDTCEHLTDACARFVQTVLRETSGIKILATSRQPLHVPGEEVLRLGPLPVPSTDSGTIIKAGAGDAVELFAQRAAAAVSGFTLTEPDLPDVIRLCRRLDGIPLAIELAAVRLRALPIAELAARIEAGLGAGTGTRRGTISRHQTLHAAIEWSYGLCTDAEKAAWRRLSVFAGTFDLAVARDVIVASDEVLGGLVDKSVVLPTCAGRYRLLDSVREYGAARLAEAGDEADCRERHLARYQGLTRDFSHRLVADGQQGRLGQLRAEHANIRAALEYGLTDARPRTGTDPDAADPDVTGPDAVAARARAATSARAAAKLAASLFSYWVMSGSVREGMHWQDKVLDRFGEPSAERASALANRVLLGTGAGVAEEHPVGQANEAIAMAARLGDERTHARGYLALQFALTTAGRYQEALEAAKQARWRLEALGAEHALRTLDMQLALTYVHSRNFDAAIEHAQRSLRGLALSERWLRGNAHVVSALAYYQQPGRQVECENVVKAAVRETQEIGYLVGEAYSLEVLAWLAADAGRGQRAAWLLGSAQALWERTGGRLSGSVVLEGYHQRSAAMAAGTLGTAKYSELHAAGAIRPIAQIAALAIAGTDVLPGLPAPRVAEEIGGWQGSDTLTAREREIAVLVTRGLSNRDIAERLVISKRTVDAHVNHIFAKLEISSRVQLTIWLRDRVPVRLADERSPSARA